MTALGVGHHLVQELTVDFLLCDRFALHELLQLLDVLVGVVAYADAFFAVAPGTAGLLIVAFDALGDVVVDNETNVGLVDTHAEGYGCHYHVGLFHKEGVLIVRAHLGVKPGMIRQCTDAVDAEELGHLLNLLAAEAVYDAALPGVLADELHDVLVGIHLGTHLVIEVGPVERRLEHTCPLDAQVLEDVALHLGSGRGRECYDGMAADFFHQSADAAVLRTEVVPPFGDTVGLVHRIKGNRDFAQQGYVFLFRERFRRHV